jgi:large subunit ribosomal protein L3
MWDKWGVRHPLTVLQVDRCQVTQVKTAESDGYYALQVGLAERPLHLVKKPQVGHFMKADVPPKNSLTEFRVTPNCVLPVGFLFSARHFIAGQTVDVRGTSKGKGFAGCIKRWHFQRQPETHGNSRTTRAPGSTGQRQDPGRTFPGKKMAGNLGNQYATMQKLLVYKIDYERDIVYVKGSVPGPATGVVEIFDSVKDNSKQQRRLPFPSWVGQPALDDLPPPEKDFFETEFWLHDNVDPEEEEVSEED